MDLKEAIKIIAQEIQETKNPRKLGQLYATLDKLKQMERASNER